jgi:hypothetical protein
VFSHSHLARLIWPWRWWYVLPKHLLAFNRLHGAISQKIELFATTGMRTSNPTFYCYSRICRPSALVRSEVSPCGWDLSWKKWHWSGFSPSSKKLLLRAGFFLGLFSAWTWRHVPPKRRLAFIENMALYPRRHRQLIKLWLVLINLESQDSVVGITTGRPRGRSSSPGGGKNFHFSMSSTPAVGTTQPPIQWVPVSLSRG